MKPAIRIWILIILIAGAVAACEPEIPTPPAVTVVITAVNNQAAVDDAVNATLTQVAAEYLAQTATVSAQGGVTLTPSPTLTPSQTPTQAPTRFVSPTPTPLPTNTPTPTFAPYLTNTPAPVSDAEMAWVRVLHAWAAPNALASTTPFDIYFNDQRISRSLDYGGQTNYIQVAPGPLRVTLRLVDDVAGTPVAPLLNTVVDAPPGSAASLVIADFGDGLTLFPLKEDVSPLSAGFARLTILHANAELLPVNLVISSEQRALAYGLSAGEANGPFDVPIGTYQIDLFDQENPDQFLESLPPLNLTPRINYVLILTPSRDATTIRLSGAILMPGGQRLIDTDLNARFVNLATGAGSFAVELDGQTQFTGLAVGAITPPVPLSADGVRLRLLDPAGLDLYDRILGPWTSEEERKTDKIILMADSPTQGGIGITVLSVNPPRSAINANIRLIHALSGAVPLSLEVRPVQYEEVTIRNQVTMAQITDERAPWITLAQAVPLTTGSPYITRVPDTYDVRVLQAGTRNVIAELSRVPMLAGGIYDFIVVSGNEIGTAALELLQPVAQFSGLAVNEGDPAVIAEAVAATLTAQAPVITATPTRAETATATATPVATNTPRPTNTPVNPEPVLSVEPAPPNTTTGTVTIIGRNFIMGRPFSVRLDDNPADLANGVVNRDGSLEVILTLPSNVRPGPHVIRVCVDCRPGGAQQAAYTPVIIAERSVTPTATPIP